MPDTTSVTTDRPPRRMPRALAIALGVLALAVAAAVVLAVLDGGDGFSLVDGAVPGTYIAVFGLVAADAVMPIFPGESTLNAASTLAAQGDVELWLVMLGGALGAIVGDSTLFWIARRSSRRVQPQLDRAKRNTKVAAALSYLDRGAPILLLTGRYVPGLRFVINSTMGLSGMPYRTFLPWSALGGIIWSVYTCALAYWVGSTLLGYPLASVVISGAITTVIIAVIFVYMRRQRGKMDAEATAAPGVTAPDG